MRYIHLLLLSHFSRVRLCVTPQTAAHQAPRPWDSPGKNTGVGCHFLLQCMQVKSEREVAHSCPTLSDPMDYSLPGSSIHGIFQYWSGVPLPSPCYQSRQRQNRIIQSCPYKFFFIFWPHRMACGILVPQPEIQTLPPALEVWFLNHWTTREVHIDF